MCFNYFLIALKSLFYYILYVTGSDDVSVGELFILQLVCQIVVIYRQPLTALTGP